MSLLGFDALGRLALGQLPSAPEPVTYGFQQGPTYRQKMAVGFTSPFNPNLFTNPIPFNQTDWSKPFRVPLALADPWPPLNINLFKNPFPFNQYDWPKPQGVSNRQPDASRSLNLNLVGGAGNVASPFVNSSGGRPFDLLGPPTPAQVFNPNLQKNPVPFNQTDWEKRQRVSHRQPDASRGLNPNLVPAVVAVPFKVTDLPPPVRVRASPRDVSVPLNPNLQKNNIPILNSTGGRVFDLLGPPRPPPVPYNPNLYSPVAPQPFNQTDWATSRRVIGESQVPDGLNPNIFTNPIPVLNRAAAPSAFPYANGAIDQALNINLFTPMPFVNLSVTLVAARAAIDVAQVYNPNLYGTVAVVMPFNQTDWSTTRRAIGESQVPDGLNPNLFTNPIPVLNRSTGGAIFPYADSALDQAYNQNLYSAVVAAAPFVQGDLPDAFFPRSAVPAATSLNPNLFTNPVPFNQTDWSATRRIVGESQVPDGLNINLFTPMPFNQTDWSDPVRVRAALLPGLPTNINLLSNNIPFNQTDWAKPQQIRVTQPYPQAGLNINLFTNPIPFGAADISSHQPAPSVPQPQPYNQSLYSGAVNVAAPPFATDVPPVRRLLAAPRLQDTLNINLIVVVEALPFNQIDWSRPFFPVTRPDVSQGLNPNLFTNPVPFGQTDWSKPVRQIALPDPPQPLNLNLFSVYVPFNQYDWPRTTRAVPPLPPQTSFNPNIDTNPIPFAQFDYPLATRVPRAPIDLSLAQPNINVFTNPVPFVQTDWAKAVRSLQSVPPQFPSTLGLLTAPVAPMPFNQYDWRPAKSQQPQRRYDLPNVSLFGSIPPPTFSDLPHSKPFFATPGKLMNL